MRTLSLRLVQSSSEGNGSKDEQSVRPEIVAKGMEHGDGQVSLGGP